jgi:hypothetical protein
LTFKFSVILANYENLLPEISVQLYPNPTHDILNISSVDHLIKTVNIYQIDGRLVYTFDVNNHYLKLNVHQFPKGIYISEIITTTNELVSKKFIVE